jgi:hypothetical protein
VGLFNKNKNKINFDDIKYAHENIQIPLYEDLQFLPLGENKNRAIECKGTNSNILHITMDENDNEYMISTILQIIKREESMVILDPDGKLYRKFKTLLFSKNYKIRYIDIDDENSNTWSFFDNDSLDINNPDAIYDVIIKCDQLIKIYVDSFLTEEEKELYYDDWVVLFGAIYAYVYTNYLLIENKFNKMYELLEYNTINDLDKLFETANDVTYKLWFDILDANDDVKESLISLSLGLIEILKEHDTNRLISTSDLDLTSPERRKSAFFFNSIPEEVDDNNCINIILNFMLLELSFLHKAKGRFDIPIYFLMNNIDFFPNLSSFIEKSTQFKNTEVSFIYTCSELDGIYDSYDNIILNKFFNSLNYVTIVRYDKENLDIINNFIIELPEGINEDTLYRQQILIAQDRVLLCKRFELEKHPIYYRICYE